jgi:hypothetical protein
MWYCRLFAIMMCQHLDAWINQSHIMHKFLWLTVWIIKQYHYKPFFTNGLFVMWIFSLFFYRFRHSFLYSIYFLINTKHQVQIIIKISFYLQDSESLLI